MTTELPILVLVCGGTIVMRREPDKGLDVAGIIEAERALEKLAAESSERWSLRFRHLMAMDSTDMHPSHWERVITAIADEWRGVRAIVIVSGTNTLAYLASALSFALRGIPIPVILTGSQIPAYELFSDARMNFINSLRVAGMQLSGVYIVFGHRIILGCRAKKVSESQLNAFASFNSSDVGEIGVNIQVRPEFRISERRNGEFSVDGVFVPDIVSLTLLPGLSGEVVKSIIQAGCKGLILRSFGSGDIPHSLFAALNFARECKIPVVNTTQCPGGATMMGINEVGRLALDYGVIQSFDMSMEAMSTKLMWLLGQQIPYEIIPKMMHTNLVGEINSRLLGI